MLVQFGVGTVLILVTACLAGFGFMVVEQALLRRSDWLARPPALRKRVILLCANVLWFLCAIFAAVGLWAATYLAIGLFETVEEAVYFSLVAYTTLGFGDILLPLDWRLLAGLESLNGLLMIGLQIAMLIEVMGRVRRVAETGAG